MTAATLNNDQILRAVQQELQWASHVDETEVDVQINGGVVSLSGTVDSYAKKMAAQEAAHRVAGVLDVVNRIQVLVPGSLAHSDVEIVQMARRALEWDVLIPHHNIHVTVSNGWVTLEGSVPFWADRARAGSAICNLAGVRGVTNNILVHIPPLAAERIKRFVEEVLARRAEREVERIRIEVEDGTVRLYGQVHNWMEKQDVLEAVGHAPGVRSIEDHLQID